jgi:two-component system, response regulator PdtaR
MAEGKRIILADDEPRLRMALKEELAQHGYLVVAETGDGMSAVHLTRYFRPDLVLMEVCLSGMDGIKAAEMIWREKIAPVVLLTAACDQPLIERAKQAGVMNYLVKPWCQHGLYPVLELTLVRFAAWCAIEARTRSLEEQLVARKVVDQAKGLLMVQYDVAEQEAYHVLRHWSMDSRKPLGSVAEAVLEVSQIDRLIKAFKRQSGKDAAERGGKCDTDYP